jgi:aspartate 1-decarboxylase
MDACGMVPFERIDVYDVDNASRFSTYLIEGRAGAARAASTARPRLVAGGTR